jgi:hypothetical protein
MPVTWIVVANRSKTRIFKKAAGFVTPVETLDDPLGRERTRKLRYDIPGMSRARYYAGAFPHRLGPEKDPHEEVAEAFAKTIAQHLAKQYQKEKFDDLVIVAEPRFLGLVRSALDKKTNAAVSKWIRKDLDKLSDFGIKQIFMTKKKLEALRYPSLTSG